VVCRSIFRRVSERLMKQWEEVIQRWVNILIFLDEFILMTKILAQK
jgi:hypothetical protein